MYACGICDSIKYSSKALGEWYKIQLENFECT